jgi:hypothetical protein
VLTTLVKRGLWESVGEVLERGVNDAKRQWAVNYASRNAEDDDFERFILPHCSDDQMDTVKTNLKARILKLKNRWVKTSAT